MAMAQRRLIAALLLAAANASAQVYKCPDASGRTVIQQMPCMGGTALDVKSANGDGLSGSDRALADFKKASAERIARLKKINRDCDARGVTALVIGMPAEDALCVPGWRFPDKFNNTSTATLFKQQVVFGGFGKFDDPPKYLYFENGKLTAIQE